MNQEKVKVNIDLKKTESIICELCSHTVFIEGLILRKASRFLTGDPVDSLIPLPVFACAKCGHVNDEFLPTPLKNTDGE